MSHTGNMINTTIQEEQSKAASRQVKKILLLWSPLADYSISCFRELAKKKGIELYIIYQPGEKDAPYKQFDLGFFKKVIAYQ
ncbi:MAG: hypothetical protein ABI480_18875, partial [Chitinophagaceae bacterium]